jgi:EAL domain-containing protein (putative c-di-GMP-specific phosphodiesterase class I)
MRTLERTKQKIFLSSILLIIILFIVGHYFLSYEFNKLVQDKTNSVSVISKKLFNINQRRYDIVLNKNLDNIVQIEAFRKAVFDKNTEIIDKIIKDRYIFKKNVDKKIKVIYNKDKKQETLSGFKKSKEGVFYMVSKEVYYKQKSVGIVYISIAPKYFLEDLKTIFDIKSIEVLDSKQGLVADSQDDQFVSNIQLKDSSNSVVSYLVIKFDISDLMQSQSNLLNLLLIIGLLISILILFFTKKSFDSVFYHFKKHTYTDALTDVGNKQKLDDELSNDKINVLILINIKEFSLINELYGISTGNNVLIYMSTELNIFANMNNMKLYRISSDEFALLKYDDSFLEDEYIEILDALYDKINSLTIEIDECEDIIQIESYFGISHGGANDNLVEKSQMALKKAKEKALPYMAYSDHIDTKQKSSQIIKMKKALKHALKNNNVVPFFQEIRDRDEKIVKYEALVRIVDSDDEKGKTLYPGDFLSIAVNGGLYSYVAKEVLNQALSFFSDREEKISINFMPNDFFQPKVIDTFMEIVEKFKDPKRIIIEITEDENIEDFERLLKVSKRFRKLGISIAIDDFGSGYANYAHILKLKPDYLKIDGSLVRNILVDEDSKILVKSIIRFAQDLGIKTIAEYVETKEIFDALKDYGVDEFQGYYFGKAQNLLDTLN